MPQRTAPCMHAAVLPTTRSLTLCCLLVLPGFAVLEADTLPQIFTGQKGPDAAHGGCYLYGRSFNPTVRYLGRQLAALEGGEAAYCCASGERLLPALPVNCTARHGEARTPAPCRGRPGVRYAVICLASPCKSCPFALIRLHAGMSAIAATLLALCSSGDHIVCSNAVYGGTFALMKASGAEVAVSPACSQ